MKPRFTTRSYQAELLDADSIPTADLYQNLKELETINKLLGGHAATLKALGKLPLNPNTTYRILDIGCGGGDTLLTIAKWARSKQLRFELVGVDLKKDCIDYAMQNCIQYPEISFVVSNYKDLDFKTQSYDIIVTSLFCHHLTDEELSHLIEWATHNATIGMVINDLHRHPFAYYSIWLLTALLSKSYLVKNDAKLSVLRGFSKKDWQGLMPQNINMLCQWQWAFRWMLVLTKNGKNSTF